MTVRVIALMAKRPDMSREEFIEYYRTGHAPLLAEIAEEMSGYQRNFVVHDGVITRPDGPELDVDVVTIIDYPDEETYQRALARQTSAENRARIAEDEENLFDRSKLRYFRVDVQDSDLG